MITINTQNKTITGNDDLEKDYVTGVCVAKDVLGVWVDFSDTGSDVRRLLYSDTIIDNTPMTEQLAISTFGDVVPE